MRIFLAACLMLGLAAAGASEPVDWIEGVDATAELVEEPVFGGRVMLYRAGKPGGDAVVLIHGLGKAAARDWAKLIPALAERHAVYALDLPGFGQSDKGNHLYSPANFARVIDAVLEARVSRPFILIGHSLGGAVALAYAGAYPQRVSRLIVADAAGVLHRSVYAEHLGRLGAQRAMGVDSPWFESVLRAIQLKAESLPSKSEIVLQRPEVRQRLLRGDPNAIAAYALVEHDLSQALRSITAPTLLIWGANDTIAPLRTGQALGASIPRARLTIIRGAGHAPHVQMPEKFNAIVLDELRGAPGPGAPYALQKGASQGGRVGRCVAKRGQEFSGDYEKLTLDNCRDAQITDARIGYLRAAHSVARIVNSQIRDGVDAKNSRLEFTGGAVAGTPPLVLDASSIDAAGTRFESANAIASNNGAVPVTLRLSVSELSHPSSAPRYVHDIVRLAPGDTLIR